MYKTESDLKADQAADMLNRAQVAAMAGRWFQAASQAEGAYLLLKSLAAEKFNDGARRAMAERKAETASAEPSRAAYADSDDKPCDWVACTVEGFLANPTPERVRIAGKIMNALINAGIEFSEADLALWDLAVSSVVTESGVYEVAA